MLSNLGIFGVNRFDAILPPGQGAIMVVGASKPSVVANADGFFSVKNKMLDKIELVASQSTMDEFEVSPNDVGKVLGKEHSRKGECLGDHLVIVILAMIIEICNCISNYDNVIVSLLEQYCV